jgi:phosphoserine phosphatase
MDCVLTLIAADAGALNDGMLAEVRTALADLGADTLSPAWLAKGRAADLPFSLLATCQAEAAARQLCAGQSIDVVAQAAAQRRKMLLLADMDSTILAGETLDDLAARAGLRETVAAMTARAMSGQVDFAASLVERVALLKGLAVATVTETSRNLSYRSGARALVATMKAHGAFTVLVSGGFAQFTGQVQAECGFDREMSNRLEIEDGRLTGRIAAPILDRAAKLNCLVTTAAERRLSLSLTLAVGDGANDLDMLQAAGLGIAFHAQPSVAQAARARIDHADLTGLLFAQGYREDEFVA